MGNMTRVKGEIRNLVKKGGYGFIRTFDTREDLYFHCSELINAKFDDLKLRSNVSFLVRTQKKGPYAIDIIVEGIPDQEPAGIDEV